jgi:tRNA1(Val) A37 N6-methylase TrmN6
VTDGDQARAAADQTTVDAFHRGRFHLVQPRRGHRAGIDAMLLAAAIDGGFSGHCIDLGSGAGAAGLAVASRCPCARVTLVERDPLMLDCARQSLALPQNTALVQARIDVLACDATWRRPAREVAGLTDAMADCTIMNPPFNTPHDQATGDPLRRVAHVMESGMFEAWIRTATALTRANGILALIARPHSLRDILDALEGRFGNARIRLIHPRPQAQAIRVVVRARRGSRASLGFVPPLVLHGTEGNAFGAEADCINNGAGSLFAD